MWLSLLRLILGPVLLWQGARVRRDILRMPEPDGPRAGMTGDGPPVSVLLLGDSSIAGVGAPTQDKALSGRLAVRLAPHVALTWRMLGRTGWTTADALAALDTIADHRFDVAVLSLGVNDVTVETGLTAWAGLYADLLARLRERHGVRYIAVSGLPPMGSFPALPQPLRWYLGQQASAHERRLQALATAAPDVSLVSLSLDLPVSAMAEDGFHPGPQVYDAWAEQLAAVLLRNAVPVVTSPAP